MKRRYNKTVKELIKEFIIEFKPPKDNSFLEREFLKDGGYFTRKEIVKWFETKYPDIKIGTISAHLLMLATNAPSRIHYNIHDNGNEDILFQINKDTFRLYDKENDPEPIYKKSTDNGSKNLIDESDEEETESQEFAYEKDLQNFLSKNLELIEPGLKLFEDDGINGIEFPAGGRKIDILALDENENYVVIELKVSRGYDRVVGQLLRYMGWIEQYQADEGQKVRGMIICKEITQDLVFACSRINDIELFEYDLSIKLNKKTKLKWDVV